jgi:hypothetical protein
MCEALRVGAHFHVAANYAGVGPRTATTWMKIGRESIEAGDNDPALARYRRFRRAIRKALTQAEVGTLARVQKAIDKHPSAGLDFLARRYGERWKRPTDRVEVDGAVQHQHEHRVIDEGAAREALARKIGAIVSAPALPAASPQPEVPVVAEGEIVEEQPGRRSVSRWDQPPDLH